MGGENLSLYTPYRALFCHRSPSRKDTTRSVSHDLGDSPYPPSLDPASTHHRSARKKGRRGTGLRVFSPSRPRCHHGVRGWPTIPKTRRYSHLRRDRQNFISRHPGIPVSSYPIKGQARALQARRRSKTRARTQVLASKGTPPTDQHLKQSPLYFFISFKTWARFSLPQLVTPTQVPRCKEIQYSPLLAGHKAFFCPNQDKSPCILLTLPSILGTHNTHSLA
jgi:hypothetical protein